MNIKIFLILLAALLPRFSIAQIDYYLQPCAKLKVDTAVWQCNPFNPSFLSTVGYFSDQRDSLVHKTNGTILYFSPVFFSHWIVNPDGIRSKPILMFNKLIMSTNYSMRQTLFFEGDTLTGVEVRSNIPLADLALNTDAQKLLETITYVDAKEIDKAAGYPLPASANQDSLFDRRKKEFERYSRRSKEGHYAEHLYTMDQQIQFTFERWKKDRSKDARMDYSECELGLAEGGIALPANVEWLSFFTNEHLNISNLDNHYLRDFYRDKREEGTPKTYVEKLSRSYNKKGIAFALYTDEGEEVTIKSFVKKEGGECGECTVHLSSNLIEGYTSNRIPIMKDRSMNKKIFRYYPVDNQFNEFILELKSNRPKMVDCLGFTRKIIMSTALHLENPIELTGPPNASDFQLFVESEFPDRDKEELIQLISAFSMKKTSTIPQPENFITSYSYCKKDQLEQNVSPQKRLYRSPLLIGDFNTNGRIDFVDIYISSGEIVWIDYFERDSVGIHKLKPTPQALRALQTLPVVQGLLVYSCQPAFPNPSFEDYAFNMNRLIQPETMVVWDDEYGLREEPMYDRYGVEGIDHDEVMAIPSEPMMESENYVYTQTSVEVKAEFPGGEQAMKKFIQKKAKYPKGEAKNQKLSVQVICTVLSDGSITVRKDTQARGKASAFEKEAYRVVEEMPKWNPAMHNGKKVSVYLVLDIPFED